MVAINNITYRGDLNGYDVFRAVCAGFDHVPTPCQGDEVWNLVSTQEEAEERRSRRRGAYWLHVVGAVILVLLVNAGLLYLYRAYSRKKMNKEMQIHVNSAVSQYFKLSGGEEMTERKGADNL